MEFLSKIPTKNLMSVFSLYVLCSCCVFATVSSLDPLTKKCKFPAVFNFGASNSDTGGFSAALIRVGEPNGMTYFHKATGRICDGRIILDFIAQNFNLPLVHHYLDSLEANFTHGINFGVIRSTIGPSNNSMEPFHLEFQFDQFSQFKNRSQDIKKKGGVFAGLMPEQKYFEKGLYTFDMGQNDIIDAFEANPKNMTKAKDIVPNIIDIFSNHIKSLYNVGARSFWIHNTGPVGCLPGVLSRFPPDRKDANGCGILQNNVAKFFNIKLKEALAQLRHQFPSAAIRYVDVYTPKYLLFKTPKKYGFDTNTHKMCYNRGEVCRNPKVKVMWDEYHYTEAANKFVFDTTSSGKFSDPPLPLNMACQSG